MNRTRRQSRQHARWAAALCAVLPLGIFLAPSAAADAEDARQRDRFERGVLIRFEGPITPMTERYLYRKLDAARDLRADLVILEIDSPGGFLDATLRIADRLRDLAWARTVAFVPSQALSGAAIAALACDDIIMAPAARLGDAGPIIQGEDGLFRHAPEKTRSELVGRLQDLARAKGRPPALAAAMADMDLIVYHVRNKHTQQETYLSDEEISNSDDPAAWEKLRPVPESRAKYFLSVNGERAVALRLAQGNALTREDLEARYGVAQEIVVLRPTGVDTAVTILNLPFVTGLLFVIGLIALYVEFSAPGLGLGGLIAALCFALFFWSRFLGGTAGWLEVILFVAGVAFLAMEVFVIPGFGIAGLTGLLLVFASILMASQHFVIPQTALQLTTSLNSILVLATSGVVFLVAAAVLGHYFRMLPVVRSLMLETPDAYAAREAAGTGADKPAPAYDPQQRFPIQIGDWGIADCPLRPAGKARFGEHFVDVVTDGLFVDKGKPVRVLDISGNRVLVREADG